jgi:nitroreductase
METLETIGLRRSIRKYKSDEVEWDKIGNIIYAAMHAPSSGNIQNWKFIVVTDEGARTAIAEASMRQLWMSQAPVHIVVCGEYEKAEQFYGIRGERLYSIQNCAAAIQNILLAATDLDLGSCWIGAFDEEKIRDICGIPGNVRPQAIITIGYADETPSQKPWKHDIYTVTFLNGWGGRIKNINHVLGYHSEKVHRVVNETKKLANKGSKSIAENFKKLSEKGKKLLKDIKDKNKKNKE